MTTNIIIEFKTVFQILELHMHLKIVSIIHVDSI